MVWNRSKPRHRTEYGKYVFLRQIRIAATLAGFIVGSLIVFSQLRAAPGEEVSLSVSEILGIVLVLAICTAIPWILMTRRIKRQRQRLSSAA
jgi:multisubunit Na+/H+ antiporter MnhE subunit